MTHKSRLQSNDLHASSEYFSRNQTLTTELFIEFKGNFQTEFRCFFSPEPMQHWKWPPTGFARIKSKLITNQPACSYWKNESTLIWFALTGSSCVVDLCYDEHNHRSVTQSVIRRRRKKKLIHFTLIVFWTQTATKHNWFHHVPTIDSPIIRQCAWCCRLDSEDPVRHCTDMMNGKMYVNVFIWLLLYVSLFSE